VATRGEVGGEMARERARKGEERVRGGSGEGERETKRLEESKGVAMRGE